METVLNRPERQLCARCLKAQDFCYCADLRPFSTRPCFVLLQHPLERKRTVGTARMAHLSLKNSLLIAGTEFDQSEKVNRLIADPANHCVVLYPGIHSKNISLAASTDLVEWFPQDKKLVIFVIDGTWPCAKRMILRSPNLLALPQICFTPNRQSEYQFRHQPHEHCLSTIEAVHHMIGILDPSPECDSLMDLFRKMVRRQVGYSVTGQVRRSKPC